ncbi:spore germination protein [Paenibacillus sp. YYML68]|uniref:spore germination protein n=1 Tax=Paenibacillus sp. YYML68 TaxID=2909250 RepID=UPI0024908B36|nr:spore germination protein [Paenibacillus sp. YYML68]
MNDKPGPTVSLESKIGDRYEESKQLMLQQFDQCSDLILREIYISDANVRAFFLYIDGMLMSEDLQEHVIRPLQELKRDTLDRLTDLSELGKQVLSVSSFVQLERYERAVHDILAGSAVLFIEGQAGALRLDIDGTPGRSITESSVEVVIRGPREAFTESLQTNLGMVRKRLRNASMKTIPFEIGEQSRTKVVLLYMEGLADPKVIQEVKRRLEAIRIDAILESGYIEELIEDNSYSPFPQLLYAEKPDSVVSQLLEGKFAIMIDGTPIVIKGPTTFWQMLQASEDYYERYMISTLVRWLRLLFIAVALLMPSLYIATTTFHQDMLPTTLILSIAAAREVIPFPALVEALIMEVAFEALREAGIRLPKTVGQAVSILGALVIGQAAVEAGIVSAPMVIVVSLTGIASFTVPRFNMAIAIRMLRFPLMILAGVFGLFGIVIGVLWITTHLCLLQSFGTPYMSGFAPYRKNEIKDIFVRAPWWKMTRRPEPTVGNVQRMPSKLKSIIMNKKDDAP